MSLNKCIQLCNQRHNQDTEGFHHSPKLPRGLCSQRPCVCQPLAAPIWFLSQRLVLPFSEHRWNGTIQDVTFRVCLLSHVVMHLDMHAAVGINSLLLWLPRGCLWFGALPHHWFIQPPAEEPVGRFQFFRAAMSFVLRLVFLPLCPHSWSMLHAYLQGFWVLQ